MLKKGYYRKCPSTSNKFRQIQARTLAYSNCFCIETITDWNKPPKRVTSKELAYMYVYGSIQ